MSLDLGTDELEAIASLSRHTTGDENDPRSLLWLVIADGVRRWCVARGRSSIVTRVGASGPELIVGISGALVRAALSSADVQLIISADESGRSVTLVSDIGAATVADPELEMPALLPIEFTPDRIGGVSVLTSGRLHDAMIVAGWDRAASEPHPEKWSVEIALVDDALMLGRQSVGLGFTDVWPITESAAGHVSVSVDAQLVLKVLEVFGPDELIELQVPKYEDDPLLLLAGNTVAAIKTLPTVRRRVQEHVEGVIERVCSHLALVRDEDGDYPLLRRDVSVYARLQSRNDQFVLQVFAVLMRDVVPSDELLRELNELNANLAFTRIFHVAGDVLAEVDLVAESLDETELRTAIQRIREIAVEILPSLVAVFGGSAAEDPAARRAAAYRNTIVEAEVEPGVLTQLTGPDSPVEWPFPGTVWVVTGWNPQGIELEEGRGDHLNRQIAKDVVDRKGKFVEGFGRSQEGGYHEASIVAWGITREDAAQMGRRALQDAVFEIDAEEMRLVSCLDDRIEAWPRRS